MPYVLRKAPRRNLYWVVGQDGTHKSKEPLPLERAKAQMRALYAREFGYPKPTGGVRDDEEEEVTDEAGQQMLGSDLMRALNSGLNPEAAEFIPRTRHAPVVWHTTAPRPTPVVWHTTAPRPTQVWHNARVWHSTGSAEPEKVIEVSKSAPSFPIAVPNPEPYITQEDVHRVRFEGGSYYPEQYRTSPITIRKPTGYKSPAILKLAKHRAIEETLLDERVRRRDGIISRGTIV